MAELKDKIAAGEAIDRMIQSGVYTPYDVISRAMAYLRNPTEPSREDKIRLLEIMDVL
jgi:hypothetical protein